MVEAQRRAVSAQCAQCSVRPMSSRCQQERCDEAVERNARQPSLRAAVTAEVRVDSVLIGAIRGLVPAWDWGVVCSTSLMV